MKKEASLLIYGESKGSHVPHFYFDTASGGQTVADAIGLPFLSVIAARAHATTLLPIMDVELPMSVGEFRSWTVVVRDDADIVVCRLIMAIINDDLSPGAERILKPASKH